MPTLTARGMPANAGGQLRESSQPRLEKLRLS
jgi:hypothetical protein